MAVYISATPAGNKSFRCKQIRIYLHGRAHRGLLPPDQPQQALADVQHGKVPSANVCQCNVIHWLFQRGIHGSFAHFDPLGFEPLNRVVNPGFKRHVPWQGRPGELPDPLSPYLFLDGAGPSRFPLQRSIKNVGNKPLQTAIQPAFPSEADQ
jgi:hypothetical protein